MDVSKFIMLSTDDFIEFVVLRNNQEYTLKVKPNLVESVDRLKSFRKRMVGIMIGPNNNNINHVKWALQKLHIMPLRRYFC